MTLKQILTATTLIASAVVMQSPANALGPAAKVSNYACTNSGDNLILRSGPGQKFKKLAGIPDGSALTVLDEVTGGDGMSWYKVKFGKRIGYVRYDYVCES